jgi:hypothetical protein
MSGGLVTGPKRVLFRRVFCIWFLVFGYLASWYISMYLKQNTKHQTPDEFDFCELINFQSYDPLP